MTYSATAKSSKPAKPRPDFPLFAHATGRWAKMIRGKLHYFGKWADPDAVLQRYVEDRDDLCVGGSPAAKATGWPRPSTAILKLGGEPESQKRCYCLSRSKA